MNECKLSSFQNHSLYFFFIFYICRAFQKLNSYAVCGFIQKHNQHFMLWCEVKKKVRTKVQQFKMNSITTFLDCQKVFFVFFFVWSRGLHILTLFCYFHASQICMFYTQCDVFEWLWFGRPKDYCRVYENTIDVICICSVW